MAQNSPENLLLAALRRHAGEAGMNARIPPIEWVKIARETGLSDKARSGAVAYLRETGLIAYTPETTEIIALTPAGVEAGDRLVRSKPNLSDPMPNNLKDIQFELDYWEIRLYDGQPDSDWWHGVKARIEGLRHREGRFLPGISITNNAIGSNSRINQNSVDHSMNAVSGTLASAAGHNQLSDRSLRQTRFHEESADDAPWQQLYRDFAKLASEEKSANALPLGAMAVPEAKPSSDVSDWVMHNGDSENLRARFELLASQGGSALGPMPPGATPFQYWFHRLYQHLRENRSNLSRFFISSDIEAPLIDAVCEASSTFCLRLQKRALEDDQESKDISARFHDWIVSNHVSVSIPAQISERNRVSLVAESANTTIPIEFLSSRLQEIRSPRGSTAFGAPAEFLRMVAKTHGLIWAVTQRGLWMAQQPPSAGVYIDAYGKQHGKTTVESLPLEDTITRRTAQVLNILIASPSDVADERDVVERVIHDWNASHLDSMGVMLHPIRWESHAYPASGNRPQGILNKQIVESGDILIGIFGYKLGTPTGRARSGTIEEIEEFRKAGKHVALYFSSGSVPRSADRSQLEAVEAYKKERQKDTLYFEFEDAASLRDHLIRQLPKIVEELRKKGKQSNASVSKVSERASLAEAHGPHIELLDVETRPVHLDERETWRIGEVTGQGVQAFLLPFYLDPRRSSPSARVEYAMAHLVFVSETSVRRRIAHGCWINASLDHTEMRPGETKFLILAIGSRDSAGPFLALSTNRTSVHWEGEAGGMAFEDFELPNGKYNVELTLIWGGNSEFQKTFEIALTIPS